MNKVLLEWGEILEGWLQPLLVPASVATVIVAASGWAWVWGFVSHGLPVWAALLVSGLSVGFNLGCWSMYRRSK
jgi:hypothetical protein